MDRQHTMDLIKLYADTRNYRLIVIGNTVSTEYVTHINNAVLLDIQSRVRKGNIKIKKYSNGFKELIVGGGTV